MYMVSSLSTTHTNRLYRCLLYRYFLNILLDTTIGVFIIYMLMRVYVGIARLLGVRDMRSGYYGRPPRVSAWLRQLCIFVMALASMKLLVLLALRIFPIFFWFGQWALAPIEAIGDQRIQVVVVMLIFPLVMNIVQFWLVDGVIKGNGKLSRVKTSGTLDADESCYYDENEHFYGRDILPRRHTGRSRADTSDSEDVTAGLLGRRTGRSSTRHKQHGKSQSIDAENASILDDLSDIHSHADTEEEENEQGWTSGHQHGGNAPIATSTLSRTASENPFANNEPHSL
jgi:hypothetical protein